MLDDDLVTRGDQLYREGHLEAALAAYDTALRRDPWSPQALCGKALVFRQLGAGDQARAALMAASAAVGYKRRRWA